MKKALKIIGISLGSIIGLLVIIALIAVYVVFTPKRLTPIVNQVADSLLLCEHQLDEVELTLFSTFPNVGARIKGLYVINPMKGALTDTVLAVPELVASVDIKKAIHGDIYIEEFQLTNAQANVYIDPEGKTNIDIIKLKPDTIEDTDTTAGWTLKTVGWKERLRLNAARLSFKDDKDSIVAAIRDLDLAITDLSNDQEQALLVELAALHTDVSLKGIDYSKDAHLSLTLPVAFLSSQSFRVDPARLMINQFELLVNGTATAEEQGAYTCDLHLKTNDWRISELLTLLPEEYSSLKPKEIEVDGILHISAHAYGRFDEQTMPLVDATLLLSNAQGRYTELPYYFDAIAAEITGHIDLNNKSLTAAKVNRLYAKTGASSVCAQAMASGILQNKDALELANPLCSLTAQVDIDLKDADYFIHSDSQTNQVLGRLQGSVSAQSKLNDITTLNLNRITAQGNLSLTNLDVIWQDSILAQAKTMDVRFTAPKKGSAKDLLSANAEIALTGLHAQVLPIALDTHVQGGSLNGHVEWDNKDTTAIPLVSAGFDLTELTAMMDTIYVHAISPKGQITQQASRRNKTQPRVEATLAADALQTQMGDGFKVTTDHFAITANAVYNKEAENILLKWNPRLNVDLNNGHADLALVGTPIDIPQMKFNYSNRIFTIDTSRIVLGHSDFSLGGEVRNVGKWLREQDTLVGALRFTSETTDVNELMSIVNHITGTDDQTAEGGQTGPADPTVNDVNGQTAEGGKVTDSDPFMVPLRVDLALLTTIRKAYFSDEVLENLGGKLYIKEGKLILEEMGFICEAAKMQLTAIYETPRRNHLYAGLDFHLIDIDIQQLIRMIPEVDSLVPMLKSFRGGAQFHIALETYLTDQYRPKPSTMRGACSIEGNDLVLLDSETFEKISKILLFSPKTENLIDSISVQIALYKNQITIYPFCLSIDNYMVALGGNHYTNMNFNYHASLLKPLYIGVDVRGNLDDLSIKPAKCRYAKDFRPLFHRDVESQSAELRRIISDNLKKNVKIQQ